MNYTNVIYTTHTKMLPDGTSVGGSDDDGLDSSEVEEGGTR